MAATKLTFPPLVDGIIAGNADDWNAACDYLRDYFTDDNNLSHTFFTMHGVDYDEDDNRVTPVDVVAIMALDEGKLGKARHDLCADKDGRIGQLLNAIPTDVDLVDASDDILSDDSPLAQLIDLLRSFELKDKAVATLLARKRPRLVPLLLPAQLKALGNSSSLLEVMRLLADELRADDGRLAYQLYYLNSSADVWEGLSQVQLLSVLLYREYERIRAKEKAEKKARKEQKRREKEEKEAAKRAKKLRKLEEKRAAETATKKEREKLEKLREEAENNPISTDAFKLN